MKDHFNRNGTVREWLVPRVAPDQRRLDRFLHVRLPALSRRSLQELFSAGKIRRNLRVAAKGDRIQDGDRITIDLPGHWEDLPLADPDVPFGLVYEDPDLLIVDKPGLIPSHPHRPWEKGTLANGLTARFPELGGRGPQALEAGLVHRLDTGTSGLLVAARNAEARARLQQDLARRRWEKKYLALVRGVVLGEEIITVPLAHHPGDRKKMTGLSDPDPRHRGRVYRAETRIRSRRQWPGVSLIEAELITGVTHQIRVHLAGRGHPVIGDRLYGPADDLFPGLPEGRHFLHAWSIALPH
ncbi:MAG: RluA family pseudouridine synthase, partial [Desulfobacterota bacterium]|nr:RluA family pseudouridine synthase [Thermodesulfobacteriota bacterium]